MSIREENELFLFAEKLQRCMSPTVFNQLAKETGYMIRKRKCHGQHFLALCVWLSQRVASTSLAHLCSRFETATGILISSEGLSQRFNSSSVSFLRKVFRHLLREKRIDLSPISTSLSTYFERIRILDSTTFQVPDRFSPSYPGAVVTPQVSKFS